jgi:hypothetical protein
VRCRGTSRASRPTRHRTSWRAAQPFSSLTPSQIRAAHGWPVRAPFCSGPAERFRESGTRRVVGKRAISAGGVKLTSERRQYEYAQCGSALARTSWVRVGTISRSSESALSLVVSSRFDSFFKLNCNSESVTTKQLYSRKVQSSPANLCPGPRRTGKTRQTWSPHPVCLSEIPQRQPVCWRMHRSR